MVATQDLYKVVWTDRNGQDHSGEANTKEIIDACVQYGNEQYPELNHRAVRVEPESDEPVVV